MQGFTQYKFFPLSVFAVIAPLAVVAFQFFLFRYRILLSMPFKLDINLSKNIINKACLFSIRV